MARLTLKIVQAEIDQLRADFERAKAVTLAFIATHSSETAAPPVVVPPATTDRNDPALFVQPAGDLNDPLIRDFLITRALFVAYNKTPAAGDWSYWRTNWPGLVARGIEINIPDYAWRRLIGWQATGADKAIFGPYR